MKPRVFLIDGSALVYRSHFAFAYPYADGGARV